MQKYFMEPLPSRFAREKVIPQMKRHLRKRLDSFIPRYAKYEVLCKEHELHIVEGANMLHDFSYSAMFKWKAELQREMFCLKCVPHLLRVAAYMKFHVAEYPHTRKICLKIMHSYLSIEGSERYESLPLEWTKVMDLTRQGKTPNELPELFVMAKETRKAWDPKATMGTHEFPSNTCFPLYDREKESKMGLCDLDPPSEDMILSLKVKIRKLLAKYGPQHINEIPPEAVKSLSPSWYSDGHVQRHDYEKPQVTYFDSFDYQKFHTDAMTEREVWLPPKAYKMSSNFWHFLAEPILKRVPFVIVNDTLKELRISVQKRWKPCKTIDLKGFGLQFPREYIQAAMECILEFYPSEDAESEMLMALRQFKSLAVRMPNGEYHWTKRGVGLGYFTNLMVLVVASILQDYNIVKMFSDDILCPEDAYEQAVSDLKDHGFILNEKKSGIYFNNTPFFAGVALRPGVERSKSKNPKDWAGVVKFYSSQGRVAGMFRQRYHYQRKNTMISLCFRRRWLMCYHYERIFGHEVQKCESFDHPTKLGVNTQAFTSTGWVRGGLLQHYMQPKLEDENLRRFLSISYPWKEPGKKLEFDKQRRQCRKLRNIVYYNEIYNYLHPRVKPKRLEGGSGFFKGRYQLPLWSDLQLVMGKQITCGRVTGGTYPKKAAFHMLDHMLSHDPIRAWLSGGYEVETDVYRYPFVDEWNLTLYTLLKRTTIMNFPTIQKIKGENGLRHIVPQSGLEFMRDISVETVNQLEEFVVDTSDIPIPCEEEEEEGDNLSLSCEDDFFVNEEEDSSSELCFAEDADGDW